MKISYINWGYSLLRTLKTHLVIRRKMATITSTEQEKMVDDAVKLYRNLAQFPAVADGCIYKVTDENIHVYSEWTQRDIERAEKIKFTRNFIMKTNSANSTIEKLLVTPPQEIQNEVFNRLSPSGKYRAIVRKVTPKKGDEKHFLEVWTGNNKIKNLDLQAFEKHGQIYKSDGCFGTLQWSPTEKKLMYIAEKKIAKSPSFFELKKRSMCDKESNTPECEAPGDEHLFREEWGEQLTGLHHPVICIIDIEHEEVSVVDFVPDDVSPSKPKWHSDDGIAFIGYCHEPWRLGLVYCKQRKSSVYYLNLTTSTCTILSDLKICCSEFAINGRKLAWLQNHIGGPHMQCGALVMYDFSTKETSVVVDTVRHAKDPEFPGLHTLNFPKRCWSKDGRRMIISTVWRSRVEIISIDVENRVISKLSNESQGVWNILDVFDDYILAVCSSPNVPHHLVIGRLPKEGSETSMVWYQLDQNVKMDDVKWSVIKHEVPPERINPKYESITSYESILIEPAVSSAEKTPVIVFPHGGPHSVFTCDFMLYMTGLCKSGYAILCVNYRGSWGYGQDFIECLPGHIGRLDVEDVQNAIEEVLEKYEMDSNRCCVIGGSHGGFLGAHLIGQYPTFYKAACLRNPVINVATMAMTTDIPDWNLVEAGHDFDFKKLVTPEILADMWKCSPIQYVDQVKAPVMLMLGKDDLRVPPKQGQEFIRALKARGCETRLMVYPDNSHPLIKVDTEADAFVNIVNWFFKFVR